MPHPVSEEEDLPALLEEIRQFSQSQFDAGGSETPVIRWLFELFKRILDECGEDLPATILLDDTLIERLVISVKIGSMAIGTAIDLVADSLEQVAETAEEETTEDAG